LLGDQIIIVSYAFFSEEELNNYSPKIVLLNKSNKIKKWLHK
jgi:aspartate 1-decarboxylase